MNTFDKPSLTHRPNQPEFKPKAQSFYQAKVFWEEEELNRFLKILGDQYHEAHFSASDGTFGCMVIYRKEG